MRFVWPNVVEQVDCDSGTLRRYYVNGLTYMHERVLVHEKASEQDYYYLLQDLYTVAGLVDENGRLAEAYGHDAFGRVYVYEAQQAWCDGDGYCDLYDYLLCQDCFGEGTGTGNCAWADVYGSDGDVDDYAILLSLDNRPVGAPRSVVTRGRRSRSPRGGVPWP